MGGQSKKKKKEGEGQPTNQAARQLQLRQEPGGGGSNLATFYPTHRIRIGSYFCADWKSSDRRIGWIWRGLSWSLSRPPSKIDVSPSGIITPYKEPAKAATFEGKPMTH